VSQLPEGWVIKTIAELCEVARGGSPRPIKQFLTNDPNGVNWIKISDATASTKYIYENKKKINPEGIARSRLVKEGDFLLSNSMSFGRPYIMKTTGCIHDGWLLLGDKFGEFDQDFLYHFLGSSAAYKQFDRLAAGSTVRNLNIDMVKGVQVMLPPLSEQKRIVAILDKTFAGINQAVAHAEKNLANSRELFESYLNTIFTQKGEGWEEKRLENLTVKITKGSSPKWQGIEYVDEAGVLFITSENVGTNTMIYKKTKFVENKFNEKDSKSILEKGDVLTNIVGASIGRTAVFDRDDTANINQAVCLMRCDKKQLRNKYLSYLLNSPFFKQILHDNEINNARANLSLGFFRSLEIPVPELIEQDRIVAHANTLLENTQHLKAIYRQKLNALTELKQSILQKAFAGELTADTIQ
jgi:type I restriction enzyme S subunit